MVRWMMFAVLGVSASGVWAQSPPSRPKFDAFEVATVKPVEPDAKSGRFIVMQGTNRFVEKAYTLKLLIAAAYDLNPRTISGGPPWITSDHYDILAVTPGEVWPTHDEQMSMLRSLLADRFKLTFHREQKVFSIYELELAKNGPKLKPSASHPDEPAVVGPGWSIPSVWCCRAAMRPWSPLSLCCSVPFSIARWLIRPALPGGTTSIWSGRRTRLNSAAICRRQLQRLRARHFLRRFSNSSDSDWRRRGDQSLRWWSIPRNGPRRINLPGCLSSSSFRASPSDPYCRALGRHHLWTRCSSRGLIRIDVHHPAE